MNIVLENFCWSFRILKSIIFWDMTPCSRLSFNRRFRGTYRLHLQGRRNRFSKPASKQVSDDTLHNHRCENLKSFRILLRKSKSLFVILKSKSKLLSRAVSTTQYCFAFRSKCLHVCAWSEFVTEYAGTLKNYRNNGGKNFLNGSISRSPSKSHDFYYFKDVHHGVITPSLDGNYVGNSMLAFSYSCHYSLSYCILRCLLGWRRCKWDSIRYL
jgi:hypothetical protein